MQEMTNAQIADTQERLYECLSDKTWRLNNLYHITDKQARHIQFVPNWAQEDFYEVRHFLSLILKARQLGFTTGVDIDMLDDCLFIPNLRAGIIAHNLKDAQSIFETKIVYAYNNLDDDIKAAISLVKDTDMTLKFANGSSIQVSTSFRSGTLQRLHISEFAKICAKYPHKAKEIITGAIQAVDKGQFVTIESTAEGRTGKFYDMCKEATDRQLAGKGFGPLDFKLFFYAWWEHPLYRLTDDEIKESAITFNTKDKEYFERIEDECKTILSIGQRAWYIAKRRLLGEDIKQEFPSTPEEAFESTIKGAYFSEQFKKIRKEGRICSVPHEEGIPVNTYWDLGMDDTNCIWFEQVVGRENHVIDYYEASGEGLAHYARILDEKGEEFGYRYGTHYGPHDLSVRELGTGKARVEQAAEYGIRFETVPRIENKMDSIESARSHLGLCWFDEEKCDPGIIHLENYRKAWNDQLGCYMPRPLHDEHSNGADAFQTKSMAAKDRQYGGRGWARPVQQKRGWA